MVRIAQRDTFGLEDTGGGVMVKRRIFAGKPIPEHLQVDSGAFTDMDAPPDLTAPEPELEPEPEPEAEPAPAKAAPKTTGGGRRTRRSTS
jgi:hypothetical protein